MDDRHFYDQMQLATKSMLRKASTQVSSESKRTFENLNAAQANEGRVARAKRTPFSTSQHALSPRISLSQLRVRERKRRSEEEE